MLVIECIEIAEYPVHRFVNDLSGGLVFKLDKEYVRVKGVAYHLFNEVYARYTIRNRGDEFNIIRFSYLPTNLF